MPAVFFIEHNFAAKVNLEMDNELNPFANAEAKNRLRETQKHVDEVVGIMKTNVEKALERDQKLSELDDRAEALEQGACQFKVSSTKLKRKYWWQNTRVSH